MKRDHHKPGHDEQLEQEGEEGEEEGGGYLVQMCIKEQSPSWDQRVMIPG